jgi:hypothetical protein
MRFQTKQEKADRTKAILKEFKRLSQLSPEQYNGQAIKSNTQDLIEIIQTPIFAKCPICNNFYNPARQALSRKDNTSICSDCGQTEALNDFKESLNK